MIRRARSASLRRYSRLTRASGDEALPPMGKAACGLWQVSSQGETHVRVAPRAVLIDGTTLSFWLGAEAVGAAQALKPAHLDW